MIPASDVQPGQRAALLPYGGFADVVYAHHETVEHSGVSIVRFQTGLDGGGAHFVARCSHELVVVEP